MPSPQPSPQSRAAAKPQGHHEPKERRQRLGRTRRSRWRWLRSLLLRPFGLRWRAGGLRVVWVERRRGEATDRVDLEQVRADLQIELLAHEHGPKAMRELVRVHDILGRSGWAGLAALSAAQIARAADQAEMVAQDTASQPLLYLVEQLRRLQQLSAEQAPAPGAAPVEEVSDAAQPRVEISELEEDDFVQAERHWANSQGGALGPATASDAPPPSNPRP